MSTQGDDMEIRRLDLNRPRIAERVKTFLSDSGLGLDGGIGYFAGLFDPDDNLVGCGGLDGNIIKCLALSAEARGAGASAMLISHLVGEVLDSGSPCVRVFTKPGYRNLFKSLGFSLCGESSAAVLLESDSMPLGKYCSYLARHKADGVIVANADPVTLGHLHLIETAASQCRRLAVITVGAHPKNTFGYEERTAMLKKATAHIGNVEILDGSEYVISQLSFPSYFIKKADEVSLAQAEIDLDIFCRHIAPSLGCVRRFVGTEPTDPLTSQYNSLMKQKLLACGIEVVEIERLACDAVPVSASRVRNSLRQGSLKAALSLVPVSDTPYFLAFLAGRALRKELDLSPKPGLVDPYDNGSHSDMDYALMSRSIESLHGFFVNLAVLAFESDTLGNDLLRELGLEAEERMLETTGGVNTHRGAIFSMGLAVAAAARVLSGKSHKSLGGEIASLAGSFPLPPGHTHGQEVRRRFGISGALENARAGYAALFESWLPFYRSSLKSDHDCLRLLMKIISEIDDSNAIYRAGLRKAEEARRKAGSLVSSDSLLPSLAILNEDFKRDNISHGGAADMLALTFFADSVSDIIE